jgi:hypothetical protein
MKNSDHEGRTRVPQEQFAKLVQMTNEAHGRKV